MSDPAITPLAVEKHGLSPEEFDRIKTILGREPNYTELGVFSVMWSEHCSYKNTRKLLKLFPTHSDKVLVGAGEENAGILDIGDGLAVAFKIESHNHPSAVEPFQGAATGVGGIIRDIFTMGARPICALNSLRFGDLKSAEARRLFAGVVAGIAHYGNAFGIPTVGGEVCFDRSYEGNPLVNAFCLGVLRHEQIVRGAAHGLGNPVFYVGPATGRDGLAGAAFASQDLTSESAEQQRGAVQVGDPFMEKLVLEACLELLATGAVAGIQDMGAAGLTCSTCETAARAGTGIEIELDKVPQRAPNMTAYEIMLSESQERMLIILKKGREKELQTIFEKWDLPWAEIGQVTGTGRMVVKHHGQIVADIPAHELATKAPVYDRASEEPAYFRETRAYSLDSLPDTSAPVENLKALMAWPTISSKNWVYRQYDHTVRDGTVVRPGSDAAVIRIKADSLPQLPEIRFSLDEDAAVPKSIPEKFVALTVDGNASFVYLDPYEGGKAVVAEAARNLACAGAVPLGLTDNLNFGNPHNPAIFYQLRRAIEGMAEACRFFHVPVTGGNVSLYNQNPSGAIDPTPTVAMVGLMEKVEHITTQWFKNEGDIILLLGSPGDGGDSLLGLGGSAYLQCVHGLKTGLPPRCDLAREKNTHAALHTLIRNGLIRSAHDCSDGGLAVALAESCISHQIARGTPHLLGAEVDLSRFPIPRLDALLYGESHGRIVVSARPDATERVLTQAKVAGVPCARLGVVGGPRLTIQTRFGSCGWKLVELHDLWWNTIARLMA